MTIAARRGIIRL